MLWMERRERDHVDQEHEKSFRICGVIAFGDLILEN